MRSSAEAKNYLNELKLRMTHLGISDCEMQEGSLRVDANVNLHIEVDAQEDRHADCGSQKHEQLPRGRTAIDFEIDRQYDLWEDTGKTIKDEAKTTRGWDDGKESTFLQREKEESADYRYFPDPDLLPVRLPAERIEAARANLGELPSAIRQRLQSQYGIKPYDANVIVNQGPDLINFYEQVATTSGDGKRTSSWIQQDVLRTLNERQIKIAEFSVSADKMGRTAQACRWR